MQQLLEILESAVGEVTFDAGRISKVEQRHSVSYARRPQDVVTPKKLSEMYAAPGWDAEDLRRASSAHLLISDELFLELEDKVRHFLRDHIAPESDRIGHAFPTGESGESYYCYTDSTQRIHSWSSPVASFTKALVRGAAVAGPDKIAIQLMRWLEAGDPVTYRTATILNGIAISQPLEPVEGIFVESLPLYGDQLPIHLPKLGDMAADRYVGRTVLHIDYQASPALFRPTKVGSKGTVMVQNVPGIEFESACEALSLESNTQVAPGSYWYHYQGPPGLLMGRPDSTWSIGGQGFERWPNTDRLTPQHFDGVDTLIPPNRSGPKLSSVQLGEALKAMKPLDPEDRTRTAITRWVMSKSGSRSLVDRFIDLRIALEALYIRDVQDEKTNQELRFKLALFGAWHLGASFNDRREARKKLRAVYDKASGAVHSGAMSYDLENWALLFEGQDLCRKGIRKLLRGGPPSDWVDLILGAEYDSGSGVDE